MIPVIEDKKSIFSEATLELLHSLSKEDERVKEFLIKHFQGVPVSSVVEEWAYNYFISHSVITAATVANPGSSMTTEFLYEGLPSPSSIDHYFLQAKAGQAVKARLTAIEEKLPKIIEHYRNNQESILIGNLGSGPGRDIINTLYYYKDTSLIKAVNIDKDKKALERGERMAIGRNIHHLIKFIQKDFLTYKSDKKFDIALLIGVLCPLSPEICVKYLKTIKHLLKPNGYLIASNASKKMQSEDAFTRMIMEWTANWKLVYKEEKDVRGIFEDAGYAWNGSFTDSYGFHIMGMGRAIF